MLKDILNTDFNEIIIVSQRALFSLITLFFITKLIGKKQVSELSLFDYVISISIGNFAAEVTMNLDTQILNGVIGVMIFGFIGALVSYLTMKSIKLRRFFMGTPTVIIENGNFVYKNLKRTKMDLNDFLQTARIAGYFDISEIKYALMEANGQISFLPKEEYSPVVNKNMNIKVSKQGLCANVIIDGKIMTKNLEKIGKNEEWLLKQLRIKGYNDIERILLACIDINDKLTIYSKNSCSDILNVLE